MKWLYVIYSNLKERKIIRQCIKYIVKIALCFITKILSGDVVVPELEVRFVRYAFEFA